MKLNATNKNTLKSIAIVFLILWAFTYLRTSKYQPVDIETSDEGSLFDLPVQGRMSQGFVLLR